MEVIRQVPWRQTRKRECNDTSGTLSLIERKTKSENEAVHWGAESQTRAWGISQKPAVAQKLSGRQQEALSHHESP